MTTSAESTEIFEPTTASELARFMADNSEGPRRPLQPLGGRTALGYGYPLDDNAAGVSLSRLNRIVDYPARDMTMTLEAGTRIDELSQALAAEGQRLPVDVAQSHRATLGGVLATNASGPRRFGFGTLRDYLIGVSAVDASGRLFHAGGRVVKNVAGYDLCKVLIGSLGTLAVITQATLKLRPLPESSSLVWMTFGSFSEVDLALERLTTSATRPVALEVLETQAAAQIATGGRTELPSGEAVLCIGFEGGAREVEWQSKTVRDECAGLGVDEITTVDDEAAEKLWKALTEFQTFQDEPLTFQANLLPSRTMEFLDHATRLGVALQAHAGNGIVVGHLGDEAATCSEAREIVSQLRERAASGHGNLVVLQCPDDWKREIPVFGDSEPSWPLMARLKQQLDPHNLLNPGRFVDTEAANPATRTD